MIIYTTAKSASDIRQILELQKSNLAQSLTPEQQMTQGFVTVIHSFKTLKKMNDTEQSIVAKDDEKVIGYLLAMTKKSKNDIPVLIPMFEVFDNVLYNNKKIAAYNYLVVGQVCIAEGYRGLGILDHCYEAYKNHFKENYEFAITEINKTNKRSIRAHERIGFELIYSYTDADNVEWDVVIWNWKKLF